MSMNGHLYRSRDDRMLAGVAGGLAELWDADPSLVRIVWALLVVLTGGVALVVYIVMAIVVPEDDGSSLAGQALAWNATQSGAGGGGAGGGGASAGTSSGGASAAPNAAGFAGDPPPTGRPQSRADARDARRAARWDARAARREARGRNGRTGTLVVGVLLILVGAWYLVREFLPSIDFDWFWPLVLVAVGVVVLVLAVRPQPAESRPGDRDRRSDES
jgi:phage shock protein C